MNAALALGKSYRMLMLTFRRAQLAVCAVTLCCLCFVRCQTLIVETNKGRVQGTTTLALNQVVTSYLGIPFAEPPVGNLRFKKPVTKRSWQNIFVADTLPNSCPQAPDTTFPGFYGADMWNPNTKISEDCLHLNIWVPGIPNASNKKAVMVWIFGGGFVAGTPTLDLYDGRILAASGDVIVVSINYRLGPLGFLYFGNDEAPGNAGLYDQLMALQWVHDNIQAFGGDPARVTIFGESAGACSVMYHLLSPLSHRLFQYGIMQSVCNKIICFKEPNHARTISEKLAIDVGCNQTLSKDSSPNEQTVLECLRQVSWNQLIDHQYGSATIYLDFGFVPTADGALMTASPGTLLESHTFKRTSVLLGSNANEGIYWLIYGYPELFKKERHIAIKRSEVERLILDVYKWTSPAVQDAIVQEYLRNEPNTSNSYNIYVADQVTGDAYFLCATNGVGEAYADAGNDVYMYHLTHRSSNNPWPPWTGVPHGYEIEYVFGQPLNASYGYTSEEMQLSSRVMKYMTNFAKTGNPNSNDVQPYWPTYGNERRYLQWTTKTDVNAYGIGPHKKKCRFWHTFVPQLEFALGSGAKTIFHQELCVIIVLVVRHIVNIIHS